MEESWHYKGYGIKYYTIGGTTEITNMGFTLKLFRGFGYLRGKEKAEKYIDNI